MKSVHPSSLRDMIRETLLQDQGVLLVDGVGRGIPGASIWAASRMWVRRLREAGLQPGDSLGVTAQPCPAFVALLVASLHEGWWLQPMTDRQPETPPVRLYLDASFLKDMAPVNDSPPFPELQGCSRGDPGGGLRLSSSGSTGKAKWFGLSSRNLFSVLESHMPEMSGLPGSRSWCMLPWHHAFGLVIDLLPALLRGEAIFLPQCDPRDTDQAAKEIQAWAINRLCSVPGWIGRLFDTAPSCVLNLQAGVIGGAPCPEALARKLKGTALQSGYGLTEASPGVALGTSGEWSAGLLGRVLGCEILLGEEGELFFRGDNAVDWWWRGGVWVEADAMRWVPTGDRVELDAAGCLYFRGRLEAAFKLDNGTWLQPEEKEQELIRQIDGVEDAVISSSFGGRGLHVHVCSESLNGDSQTLELQIRKVLGGIEQRLESVQIVPASAWPRNSKGNVIRSHLI